MSVSGRGGQTRRALGWCTQGPCSAPRRRRPPPPTAIPSSCHKGWDRVTCFRPSSLSSSSSRSPAHSKPMHTSQASRCAPTTARGAPPPSAARPPWAQPPRAHARAPLRPRDARVGRDVCVHAPCAYRRCRHACPARPLCSQVPAPRVLCFPSVHRGSHLSGAPHTISHHPPVAPAPEPCVCSLRDYTDKRRRRTTRPRVRAASALRHASPRRTCLRAKQQPRRQPPRPAHTAHIVLLKLAA